MVSHAGPAIHDFAIIGGGIAGASVGWRLAERASVVVLEREPQPGYHATGRSAAMFMEAYGPPAVRLLTRASRAFYEAPPADFVERPVLSARGCLYVAEVAQETALRTTFAELAETGANVRRVDVAEALVRVPLLREDWLCGAIAEDDARDIDVHALYQGFLRGLRARDGRLMLSADVATARRDDGVWQLGLSDGRSVIARTLVNAAGAWADIVAETCGAFRVGIEPRRRTAFTFPPPAGYAIEHWPAVISVDETFYFKPDAGQLLGSPANADRVAAHDVMAEELDVAIGIHRIEEATHLQIRRPSAAWAGLRSFAPDGDLVIGWDANLEGFFWLAGQGGYGIQTAAAASELAAVLLRGEGLPSPLAALGFRAESVAPSRLRHFRATS